MNDEKPKPAAGEPEQETAPADPITEAPDAEKSVKKGGVLVVLMIILSLAAYMLADRFTPVTSQARIEGYVVGVAPDVSGRVTDVWVRNNQEVMAGDPLFQIDRSQYEIALESARTQLENAERQMGAGSAAVEAARASLRAAQANERKARQDASRLERLYAEDPGTISVRRLEIARATLEQAEAGVTAARADIQRAIEQMGGDDAENNTLLKGAVTAVNKAELDLRNTLVRAPSRGMITDLRADPGQFASAGHPVLTLIPIHDVWINAEFTENNLGHIRVGTPVDIVLDALPGRIFDGEIRSVGLGVSDGRSQPVGALPTIQNDRDWLRQAQRFPVIIEFDTSQADELRQQLRIGGQATVIAYSDQSAILDWLGRLYIRINSWLTYAY
ncbi:HlyD family secretion protein [Marinobacter sp. M1N3S26]|uniref:HlyD family secretion protein n=1 Tax=unclassified Marinobacter TaxID=83889 RepID=UPI00387B1E2C